MHILSCIDKQTGNITDISVEYDKRTKTITCASTGGPATEVDWFKDNEKISITMISNEDLYDYSQIIINTASATYENQLRIVAKSSEAAGTYTCEVTNLRGSINENLYVQGNNY